MLKKLFLSLTVAGLAITSIAANNTNSLYQAGQFGLAADVGYISNDYPDQKTTVRVSRHRTATVTTANRDYDATVRFGAFYFPFANVGVNAMLPVYTAGDSFELNTVDLSLVGRVPVSNSIGLYSKLGTSWQWKESEYDYFGAVGAQYNLTKQIGVYSEVNYQVKDFDSNNLKNSQTTLRLGVSLVF